MIIYNVTVKITKDAHDDWVRWMKEQHIPDVMATGLFEGHKFLKILHQDEDGITYAIQYFCPNIESFQKYVHQHAPKLQAEHTERYKDQYVAFRTLMEEVG